MVHLREAEALGVLDDERVGVDVLVATTIIESGIDNPHTNKMCIRDRPTPCRC